jgi:peroxiredoxin
MRPRFDFWVLVSVPVIVWLLTIGSLTERVGAAEVSGLALAFEARTIDAQPVELAPVPLSSKQLTVICFLGTDCPMARVYAPRLSAMARELGPRGVRFIAIDSNQQDSEQELRAYAAEYGLDIPLVKDENNVLADRFGAERTPEVFVLDPQLKVIYRGRIDDQYAPGMARSAPTRRDLRDAVEDYLAGRVVANPLAPAVGCRIGRVKPTPSTAALEGAELVTYSNQVARVLQRNCVECHRAGEIAPFALTDYAEVAGWVDTMLEVIDQGRMPPWHADPAYGSFSNTRHMPAEDIQVLRDWAAAGTPEGDPAQLPPLPELLSGWRLPREPDAVFAMADKPYSIPAEGTVDYQYFVVDPGFTEDKWVSAAEVIPGNRAVVHHTIVYIRPPDGGRFRGVGWLTAYVPGQREVVFPPGSARLIPAGSKLVFQMHYTPNGSEQQDQTQIGMTFIPEQEVTHEVFTVAAIDQEFEIPPGAAAHPVRARLQRLPKHGELLAVAPHMHLRGRSFTLLATRDGQQETLLNVPRYDFNWQHSYEFTRPLPLANVESLEFVATFDNSADNPFNPDPTQFVTWGDQTWEEMAIAFFEVSEPRDAPKDPASSRTDSGAAATDAPELTEQQKAERFADSFLRELDRNGDGRLEPSEAPLAVRRFSFRRFDLDSNGIVTREELIEFARTRGL